MAKHKPPREIVRDGIVKLLMDDPFWACILMRLKVVMTDTLVECLGTDGKYLICNNSWISGVSFMEAVAGFVHEACHIAFKHNFRRGNRNFLLWNYACDYAINQLIAKKDDGTGRMTGYDIPSGWLYDRGFEGMCAEQIYDILLKQERPQDGAGQGVQPSQNDGPTMFDSNGSSTKRPDGGDIVFDYPAPSEEEMKAAEEMADIALQGAYEAARQAGKAPGYVKMEMEARHKHVIDYKELLRDWLCKNVFIEDYDWLQADRRFTSTGFHIPALMEGNDGQAKILLVVDVSGSMLNDIHMPKVASEIQGVLEEFPGKYFVIYTDTELKGEQEITSDTPLKLDFQGGGGTSFGQIMHYIKHDCEREFEAILLFTDMETTRWGKDPGKPVLWMNVNLDWRGHAPFGRVIDIK